jgi:hypothetical protein
MEFTGLKVTSLGFKPNYSDAILIYDFANLASYSGSGTTVYDISGQNDNGTILGSPTLSSGTLVLNGTTDGVYTTASRTSPLPFSFGVWFKTSVAEGKKIFGFEDSITDTYFYYDRVSYLGTDGKIRFGMYDGSIKAITTTNTYNDNIWHYLVCTFDSSNLMNMYVDGTNIGSLQVGTLYPTSYTGYWHLGYGTITGWPAAASGYFNGSFGLVEVYSTAISSSVVSYNYNATKYRFGL